MKTPLLLFLVALASAALVSTVVFERLPHVEDEVSYLFQAKVFAQGKLYAATPSHPDAFHVPFIIDYEGRRFTKYPPGQALILSAGVLLGCPWLVNPFFGALSIVVIYLLGQELYGRSTALLAAGLGLTSPLFLILAGTYMSHPTCLFAISLFILFFARRLNRGRWPYPLLAGAALGVAFLIRPLTALSLAAPLILWSLLHELSRNQVSPSARQLSYLLIAVGFLPLAALLPLYNFQLTGQPSVSLYSLYWPYDRLGFGPQVGPDGHTLTAGLANALWDLLKLSADFLGWPGLSLIFVVIALLLPGRHGFPSRISRPALRSHPPMEPTARTEQAFTAAPGIWDNGDKLLGAAFLCLVLAHTLYWVSATVYGPRYYYEALPLLLLLTARGIEKSWEMANTDFGHRFHGLWTRNTLRPALILLVAGNLALYLPLRLSSLKGLYDVTAAPLRAVEEANLRPALVFVSAEKGWTEYGAQFCQNSPSLDSDIVYALDRGAVENSELMAEYPHRRYFLMKGTALEEIRERWEIGDGLLSTLNAKGA